MPVEEGFLGRLLLGTMCRVSSAPVSSGSRAGAPPDDPLASPPARRLTPRRWRDPRLWLGGLLVCASVLTGASVLRAADDTVAVWAADTDLRAGTRLQSSDVRSVDVRLGDGEVGRYLAASTQPPAGAVLRHDVSAGELLPAAAVTGDQAQAPQLPLGVTAAGRPADLAAGDRVDVWAVPQESGTGRTTRVLAGVPVVAVGESGPGSLDAVGEVLVSLPAGTDVSRVLTALRDADIVLVRVDG